ncbi:hypothetical protein X797_007657 [Metarhizium robertsii]|uniref:Uncharacterized protein n=1 Tax=Metarhizium robertsii TaxID=568076 RepID=A0A014N173_9HYPO|nr:hypothetical protein X797_007657 [Metarhizium robertsii]
MQLTNLFVLASVALGAMAQYDDGFYNEAAYEGAFDDSTYATEVAVAYGGNGEEQVFSPEHCEVLDPPVGGQVNSVKVIQKGYCQLFLDNNCNPQWLRGTYKWYPGNPRQRVTGEAVYAHTIKCRPS